MSLKNFNTWINSAPQNLRQYICVYVRNIFCILFAAVFLGTVSMIAVYSIPTDKMLEHTKTSVEFLRQGEVPRWSNSVVHTTLDNFADSLMLANAVYPVENPVRSAMLNPSWQYMYTADGKNFATPALILSQVLENGHSDLSKGEYLYPRYWHGYLTVLKPMLYLFKSESLRVLNLYIQFFLIVSVLILLYKRLSIYYVYAYAILIMAINPISSVLAFQHTNVFCTTLIMSIIMLLYNDKLKQGLNYAYFFTIIGITTAFFDFLTNPPLPLGVGLSLYIALNRDIILTNTVVKNICQIFVNCFSWAIGYAGMWSGKICVASMLTDFDVLGDALGAFTFRTSHHIDNKSIGVYETVAANAHSLFDGPIRLVFIAAVLYFLWLFICKYKAFAFDKRLSAAFIFVFALPFLWYAATCNHSFAHNHFTYRELTIAVFALLSFLIESIPNDSETQTTKNIEEKSYG